MEKSAFVNNKKQYLNMGQKKLEDYIHLYLGCPVKHSSFTTPLQLKSVGVGGPTLGGFDDDAHYGTSLDKIQLLLRHLSSMTEEEAIEMEDYMWDGFSEAITQNRDDILKMFTGPGEYRPGFSIYVRAINWCRKHSFDCDELLESNLAIQQTPPNE